jgi:DNA polymerase-3 subunit alpha
MSLVNASLRPSGKSYRDRLIAKEFNSNPSEQIDELLKDNHGYLVYQEDTIKFLTDICGFTGSEADSTRRAIGKKDIELLNQQLPKILKGYCDKSDKPKDIAENEVKQFIKIIDDSSEYQFSYNHSTAYSMLGYVSALLRTYHPLEFITAYLNRAENEDDLRSGWEFAKDNNIKINPIKFRYSHNKYTFDKSTNSIYKGLSSVKGFGEKNDLGGQLLQLKNITYDNFIDVLIDIDELTSVNTGQLKVLTMLDYFSEFGDINKLLKAIDIFDNLYGIKQINKNKVSELGLTHDLLEKHSKKITKQLYKELDIKSIIIDLYKYIKFNKTIPVEKLISEKTYYGYIQTTYQMPDNYGLVTDINTKHTPKIKVYIMSTGREEVYKIYKNKFYIQSNYDNPNPTQSVNIFDVIQITKTKIKPRVKKVDNEWVELEDNETILEKFITKWRLPICQEN